jgi:hypothetical protein
MAQALSVVHIFISGKSPKYGLPQHPDECMPAILGCRRGSGWNLKEA